ASLLTFRRLETTHGEGPLASLYANAGGVLGQGLAGFFSSPLGWLAVWTIPLVTLAWGWNRLCLHPWRPLLWRTLALAPLTIMVLGVLASLGAGPNFAGSWGTQIWSSIQSWVGPAGGFLLLAVAVVGFLLLEIETLGSKWGTATQRLGRLIMGLGSWVWDWTLALPGLIWAWFKDRFLSGGLHAPEASSGLEPAVEERPMSARALAAERRAKAAEVKAQAEAEAKAEPLAPTIVDPMERFKTRPAPTTAKTVAPPESETLQPVVGESVAARPRPTLPRPPKPATSSPEPETLAAEHVEPLGPEAEPLEDAVVVRALDEGVAGADDHEGAFLAAKRKRPSKTPKALFAAAIGKYTHPKPDILDDVPDTGPTVPEEELVENSRILTETLRDFGISGRVGEVHPGPVITRYEFTPGPGVKVAQILNRQDDLALKLRAIRIRIVAPIPGKAAVGIEVPNQNPKTIHLRKLLESDDFTNPEGVLTLALGKDINGYPVVTELTKMPHLLIAGTTGSGKSVCVNSIITSLLMKHSPTDLRLLMIDPKMLELPMYNGIPHLLTDVVTDPKLAARSLKWLLVEMERRYKVLAARGSRNIQSYNAKLDKDGPEKEDEEKLPYIVVLIDELADLMITSGNEVEEPIGRLAQTARAVGIHLIVATQRPSVDVLTGVIKANFPCRIAFQVASRTDSRTILDQNGAETLLGRGDGLFLPPGTGTPKRVHGAFVAEEETQALAKFLQDQKLKQADISLEAALEESESRAETSIDDDLYEDAARLVVAAGQGSASLLQRRLKVGYARAGRLVDMLEASGILAPSEGSKARDVLLDQVQLEHLLRERDEEHSVA
ncbi:MAG: DNA translocase FtsK, partial [Candidatus Eisenbacteria bacterium]|nr:DNA translocase FtsK [Candidatus Eisenbacteria bacterium]